MLSTLAPPRVGACLDSVRCVFATTSSVGAPNLVLLFAISYVVGARVPDLPIFTEFICRLFVYIEDGPQLWRFSAQDDAAAVIAESRAPKNHMSTSNLEDLVTRTGFNTRPAFWRQLLLTFLGVVETFVWSLVLVSCMKNSNGAIMFQVTRMIAPLVSWVYGTLQPNLRPSCTPYYDLFTVYLAYFLASCLSLYERVFSDEVDLPLEERWSVWICV